MKSYNWKKMILIFLVCTLAGGVGGFTIGYLGDKDLSPLADKFLQASPILFVIATMCAVISLGMYFYYNHKMKAEQYSEEEDSYYEKHGFGITVAMTLATICAILNFTAFGLNINNLGRTIFLFFPNVILSFFGEVSYIALIKKVRPELNADPLDTNFSKKYFDRLDECEKYKVGKASFDTVIAMTPVYVVLFIIAFIVCDVIDVSPLVCMPIGLIWLIQTILYTYFSLRADKKSN